MDEQDVIQLEKQLLTPEGRADRALIDRLLADDFVEVGSRGNTFGKELVLERLPQEGDSVAWRASDFICRMMGQDVALVTFLAIKVMDGGEAASRRVSLWRRLGDGWQMVFHQGTPVKE